MTKIANSGSEAASKKGDRLTPEADLMCRVSELVCGAMARKTGDPRFRKAARRFRSRAQFHSVKPATIPDSK